MISTITLSKEHIKELVAKQFNVSTDKVKVHCFMGLNKVGSSAAQMFPDVEVLVVQEKENKGD